MILDPPKAIEAERALLGCCLISGCSPPCSPNNFVSEQNRVLAGIMRDFESRAIPVDLVTVGEKFADLGHSASYVSELTDCISTDENLETYSGIVKSTARLRAGYLRALNFTHQCSAVPWPEKSSLLDTFCSELLELSDGSGTRGDQSIKDVARDFIGNLQERMDNHQEVLGIESGLKELDSLVCGWNPQDLIVVAARPSMGKTALALQVSRMAAMKENRVHIFSLEMPSNSIMQRMVAGHARIELNKIRYGRLDGEDYGKVAQATNYLSSLPITITDHPCSELDIIRKTRKIKPDLVVIDYLQLIQASRKFSNQNEEVGHICTSIKNMAKELDLPVILLSQLSRKNVTDNREPGLSDLRASGQIEQDADVVIFLHAKGNDHLLTERKCIVAKNRQGECGAFALAFLLPIQRLERFYGDLGW